jgi:methyl-accepting chemotaxis protein
MIIVEKFSATSEQSSVISKQVAEAIQQVAVGAEDQSHNALSSSDMVKKVTNGGRKVS